WRKIVRQYQTPSSRASIWQVCNSFVPFFVLWILMYYSLSYSYFITLALAIPTAGFLIRIFIIQHDCGHGSFFKSRRANDYLGTVCGILTLTPYYSWRKSHSIHHATAGNLEERGPQDVYTLTVDEYLQSTPWERLKYRLYRNPITLFVLIPMVLFVIIYRLPMSSTKGGKREQASIHATNLVLALIVLAFSLTIGWQAFLLVQFPITLIATTLGTWIFFVQHQFEDTYWADQDQWDYKTAALEGSSFYKLPKVLQWFTGNIGFHHIHHLSPRIPNYLLEKCHQENPMFQEVVVLTLWSSFESTFLSLWDEDQKKLVSFGHLRKMQRSLEMAQS
ncbi:MAG: fatty acid desaturase, partial [Anaerolineae bacterium]|nr:fatty acid desaturase [Anaerolineae bacterium]